MSVSRNGKIGSHDPVQAIDEALREFPSDEILLAHHPAREKRHGRAAVVDICRERYDIPVTAVPDEHAVDEPSLPRS